MKWLILILGLLFPLPVWAGNSLAFNTHCEDTACTVGTDDTIILNPATGPTTEGQVGWDATNDEIEVGDSATTQIFMSVQKMPDIDNDGTLSTDVVGTDQLAACSGSASVVEYDAAGNPSCKISTPVTTGAERVGEVLRFEATDDWRNGNLDLANTDAVEGILAVANGGTGAASMNDLMGATEIDETDVYAWSGASTHTNATISGGDSAATTTRPAGSNIVSVRTHNTDCTLLTDGKLGEVCADEDDGKQFVCVPSAGDCSGAEWLRVDADSGGAPAFSALTTSTNTTATMTVGTGASIAVSGTGSVTATQVGTTVFADNAGDDEMLIGTAPNTATWKAAPNTGTDGCSAADEKVTYKSSDHTWGCALEQAVALMSDVGDTNFAALANGQVLIRDQTTDTKWENALLTATANETEITNAAGAITIGIVTSPTLDGTNFSGVPSSALTTEIRSMYWGAGAMSSDGTNCASPAEVVIPVAAGIKQWGIICADGGTIYGSTHMPDGWDTTGDILFTLSASTPSGTPTLAGDFSFQCKGDSGAIDNTWATGGAADITFTTTDDFEEVDIGTIDADTECDAGDAFWWRWVVDDATNTNTVANILGVKLEYYSLIGD